MLVLFETPAGYSLFKVSDEARLAETDADDIYETFFSDAEKAKGAVALERFEAYADTAAAVEAATATATGQVSSQLRKFLKKCNKTSKQLLRNHSLAVADKALAVSLKEQQQQQQQQDSSSSSKLKLNLVHNAKTQELFRGIRGHLESFLGDHNSDDKSSSGGISPTDVRAMQLGLSHSLSRYKLKFRADKVDTMIIQAIGLLDELDKEINTYAMRVKEWYGWHFPELQGILTSAAASSSATTGGSGETNNKAYSELVLKCGLRQYYRTTDLSGIIQDESVRVAVKEAAEMSMGTEIAETDVLHMQQLADQVLSMTEYRGQLFEYLQNRMHAIAPNLTVLVGALVGARLIAHAGSLMHLAKQPASTIQILGAEKALFRALKTKHDTPKYGLIYHASLVGQAAPKHKGKISRVLAAKSALAVRVDALAEPAENDAEDDQPDTTVGYEGRAKVEARLRQLEGGGGTVLKSTAASAGTFSKYDAVAAKTAAAGPTYNPSSDVVLGDVRIKEGGEEQEEDKKMPASKASKAEEEGEQGDEGNAKKKKKKDSKKKKNKDDNKKKKRKREEQDRDAPEQEEAKASSTNGDDDDDEKKKKKAVAKKEKKKKKRKAAALDGDQQKEDQDDEEAANIRRKAAKKARKESKKEK